MSGRDLRALLISAAFLLVVLVVAVLSLVCITGVGRIMVMFRVRMLIMLRSVNYSLMRFVSMRVPMVIR